MASGHGAFKVNFSAGDQVYWGLRRSFPFRGRPADLGDFLERIYSERGITDQIVFGDRRPVHRVAIARADRLGIRSHVFEEGYFRPYWITLEREGVNGHSLLPRDPDWFWSVGGDLPDGDAAVAFSSPFSRRAFHDVAYHLAGVANPLFYPGYQTHAPVSAPLEYLGFLRRMAALRLVARRDAQAVAGLVAGGRAFFLLPLQLDSDAQIRDHSRFAGMDEVMTFVMDSFARHAPPNTLLVIKNHPLDSSLLGHRRSVRRLIREFALDGRVDYLESGDLERLVARAQGVVTVNSTVGSVALGAGCPTVALSDPIYNLPGLTFQGALDAFWKDGEAPNAELFRRFRNAVMHVTQVNGGFYCRAGIDLGVRNSIPVLEAERSPLEALG